MQNGPDSVLDSVLESGHKAVDFPFPTSCEVFRKNSKPPYRVFLVANQSHRNEHLVGSGYEDISQVEVAFTLLLFSLASKGSVAAEAAEQATLHLVIKGRALKIELDLLPYSSDAPLQLSSHFDSASDIIMEYLSDPFPYINESEIYGARA